MKRIFFLLVFVAAIAAWCPLSFAARQTAVGPGIIPLDADGVLNGVDMSVSGITGTLSVGVPGGPEMDIFTSNTSLATFPLAVSTSASSQGNIVFNSSSTVYGNIGVTQPGGPFLLNIDAGAAGATVNFLGSVFATTLNVTGTGAVNFNSGSTNITATNFGGDGTISLAPNTTVIGALTTTAGANTGTLSLGGGSVLDGAVGGAIGLRAINVVGGDNTAGVSATITGATNAYSFSLGTNTLNIGGALTLATDGVINTTLAGTSPAQYGHIVPTGASNLGPRLGVNVTVPSTAYIPVGTLFNIVDATSGTNGSVVTVTVKDPTNPLYAFSPVPLAGTTNGLVEIKTDTIPLMAPIAPPPGVPLPPVAPIAAPVVPVLIDIPPTPDLVEVLAPINAITDPAAVVNAVAQLAPSTPSLAAPLVTFRGIRQFQNLWSSRLDMCREVSEPNKENPNCQGNEPRNGWWLKGFGYSGNQDAEDGFTGYNTRTLGTMIACDTPIGLDTRAGLGFGYARSTINGETFDASTEFDSYQAIAYIGHEDGPWFVNGSAEFGWNEYSSMRHIEFPGVDRRAKAEYSGQDYTAFASTGFHLSAPQEFTITPLASLQYTRMHLNGYTEKGAGDIDLKAKAQDYDFLESGLGVKVERYFSDRNGTSYVPEGHFNWFRELSNPDLTQTAKYTVAGSGAFTTPRLKTADDMFNVGGGLTLLSCACSATTWSLEAVYDYDWNNSGYFANQVMVRLTSRF
ncbi:MAG: autotransporter domain-containing protein [Sedimentisphaerales bacterium]|jgi:uncharacterized protein with beta-barrel porin domain